MRRSLILVACFTLLFISCSKDKLTSRPSIKIVSVEPSTVSTGGAVKVRMKFTDKEGDISSYIYMHRERINKRVRDELASDFEYPVPVFPTSSNGEIIVKFDYADLTAAIDPPFIGNNKFESDSVILHISLEDLQGNISDTVSTKTIVVLR